MINADTSIRTAKMTDVADIRECARLAYQHYIARMQREPAPMLADFEKQVAQAQVSVALSNEFLVGYVVFYPQSTCVQLENVAVLPSYSGLGIGKRLISYVEQQAHTFGLNRIELYTNEMMYENIAMYSRLGYTEVARKSQHGFNRVFFQKTV